MIEKLNEKQIIEKEIGSKECLNLKSKFKTINSNIKGITLIALIITIIVMLILLGVTVNIAINGGLFEKAREAKTKTEEQIDIEQKWAEGRVQVEGKWYDSIDDYFEGKVSKKTGPLGDAIDVTDYGKKVINYKSKEYPDLVWRLFYKDKNNVYLISETSDKDYPVITMAFYDKIENNYEKKDIIDKYNSGADVSAQGQDLMPIAKAANLFTTDNKNRNIVATAYLCDTSDEGPWEGYRDAEGKAVWAMGGPTIELFVSSLNVTQKQEAKLEVNNNGYDMAGLGYTNEFKITTDMNRGIYRLKSNYWWLASPSRNGAVSLITVCDSAGFVSSMTADCTNSIRPVVCIPRDSFSGFTLEE